MNIINTSSILTYKHKLSYRHFNNITWFNQSRTNDYQDTIDFLNSTPIYLGRNKVLFKNPSTVNKIISKTLIGKQKLRKGLDLDKLALVQEQLTICSQLSRIQTPIAVLVTFVINNEPNKWSNLLDKFKTCLLSQVNKGRIIKGKRKLTKSELFFSYVGFKENDQKKGLHIHFSMVVDKEKVNKNKFKYTCKEFEERYGEVKSAWVSKLEKEKEKACEGCSDCLSGKLPMNHKRKYKPVRVHYIKRDTVEALSHLMYITKNLSKETVNDNGKINNLQSLRNELKNQNHKLGNKKTLRSGSNMPLNALVSHSKKRFRKSNARVQGRVKN